MTGRRITECEIQLYVDDQLDAASRLEVADYLVRHPAVAAAVLADLRTRDAMRGIARAAPVEVSDRLAEAARRVDSARARGARARLLNRWGSMAAALLFAAGFGITAHQRDWHLTSPARAAVPVLMEEALMSHRTALMRAHMPSQRELPRFDPRDVRLAAHIQVPQLRKGWRILDVQLFPSDYGPSLQIVIDAGRRQPLSLFAARATTPLPARPEVATLDGSRLAYWGREGTAYVLTGQDDARFLAAAAADLSDNQDAT